jgi:SAM-dependent methyltransferase
VSLGSFLSEPELAGLDIEDPDRINRHLKILSRKRMIREVFEEFYHQCMRLDQKYFGSVSGKRIEVGAGISFFKKLCAEVMITDINPAPHLDRVLDAQATGLEDQSVRAIYGINCFHHFPAPEMFFKELLRIVKPGGGSILIEPYYGPLASLLYKKLFASESFDKEDPIWSSMGRGVMRGANQALSYIVFRRDRAAFERQFPDLEIIYAAPLRNYVRYFLSGGLNFRQLLPDFAIPLLKLTETAMIPLERITALHHILVLRKRNPAMP